MNSVVNGATFSFAIRPGYEKKLEDLLAVMDKQGAANNDLLPMDKIPSLHYATWVIVPEEHTPTLRKLPACLLLATTYNGSLKNHINELSGLFPDGLHQLLVCCIKYDEKTPSANALNRYLKKNWRRSFVYNAYQYTNKTEIKNEALLRDSIESFLDEEMQKPEFSSLTPQQVREKIQEFIRNNNDLKWAQKPIVKSRYSYFVMNRPWILLLTAFLIVLASSVLFIFSKFPWVQILIGTALLALVVIGAAMILSQMSKKGSSTAKKPNFIMPAVAVLILMMIVTSVFAVSSDHLIYSIIAVSFLLFLGLFILMMLLLRINERINEFVIPPDEGFIKKITDRERQPVCNEMNVIGPLKRGYIRPVSYAFILWVVRHIRAFGFIPTVHTSRWLQLDGGWRLVFISYFDNTSEGYANDFVDSKSMTRKVNLMFSSGFGFPPSRWGVFSGGKDRRGYMEAVRRQGKITNLWYISHPTLSVVNIRNNRNIRAGLWNKMNDMQVSEWLQLF